MHRSPHEPDKPARATSGVAAAVCAVWLVAAAVAQIPGDPANRVGQDPVGMVVDETGAAVGGARVRVEAQEHVAHEFAGWLRAALRHRPVPQVHTTKDGSFVLPLLPDHRRLGTGTEPSLVLIIEAAGHQAWHEPLPFGLAGFLGTHAVLHRFDAADAYDILVVDPSPGAILWVRRLGDMSSPEDTQLLDVPADGRVAVMAPLLPTPLVRPDWRSTRELGHDAQVLAPGRSSARVRLDPAARTLEVAAAPHARVGVTIRDAAGRPVPDARALYRLPDESLRWFTAAESPTGAVAARDDVLALIAVGAIGFVSRAVPADAESIVLSRHSPAPAITRTVRDREQPRPDAEAWLVPLDEALCRLPSGPRGVSHARSVAVDARGQLELATEDASAWALVVNAPGCAPRTWLPEDLADVEVELLLDPAPTASLRVRVRDAGGEPLGGADVRLPAAAFLPGARIPLARTDKAGTCTVHGLRPGSVDVIAVGDGVLARTLAHLREGDVGEVELTPIGQHLRAVARDERGGRVPFAPFGIEPRTGPTRRHARSHTDALGRLELPFQDGDRAVAFLTDIATAQTLRPGQIDEVEVVRGRCAVVGLPSDAVVLRAVFSSATGSTTERLRVTTSRLFVAAPAHVVRIDLVLAEGPPVVLFADELGRLDQRIELARHEIVRRVPLRITDEDGNVVAGARVIQGFGPDAPKVFDTGEAGPVQVIDGTPVWCARDRAEHQLAVFHPDFLPKARSVPAANGALADGPLEVVLTRGAAVSVAIHDQDARSPLVTLRITQGDNLVLSALVPTTVDADGTRLATLPCALAPGSYSVHLERGNEVRRIAFRVQEAERVRLR